MQKIMNNLPKCDCCENSYSGALVIGKVLAYENKKIVKDYDYVEVDLTVDDNIYAKFIQEEDMYDYNAINNFLANKFSKDMAFDEDDNHTVTTICPNCKSLNYY